MLNSFMDVMGVVLAAKQEGKDSSLIRFSVRWNDSRGSNGSMGVTAPTLREVCAARPSARETVDDAGVATDSFISMK